MNDSGPVAAVLLAIIVILIIGAGIGKGCADESWKAKLVDDPDYIAAIRSSVIAEREVMRLKHGKR